MYKEAMRFHIHGTRLRSFLQTSRSGWGSSAVWTTIDMDGISRAFKTLPTTKRFQVSKMLYGWMNTGHQRAKINNQSRSNCPHCLQEDETQEHIITCSDGRVKACRYNALVALRSALTTKGGSSRTWDILNKLL